MNHVYFYLRVSHLDSATSGIGIQTQMAVCSEWWAYQRRLGNYPEHRLGEGGVTYRAAELQAERNDAFFIDEHVSAKKKPMRMRKAGFSLWCRLQVGDVLVIPYLDRAFRHLGDFVSTIAALQEKGVIVVFLNPPVDLNTIWGKAMAGVFAIFAQIDSELKSQRAKEVASLAHVRMKFIRLGYKRVQKGQPVVPDIWIRFLGLELILGWRAMPKKQRPTLRQQMEALEELEAFREDRPKYKLCHKGRQWTIKRIELWTGVRKDKAAVIPGMRDRVSDAAWPAVEAELWKYRGMALEALGPDRIPPTLKETIRTRTTPQELLDPVPAA